MKLALWLTGCLMISTICMAAGREGVVRLNGRAGVAGEAIRLSDLLPGDAPADLRAAAAAVELGKSPQLASARVLAEAQIAQRLKSRPDILARIFIPERVTVVRRGWTIMPLPVKKAIAEFAGKQHWDLGASGLNRIEIAGDPQALTDRPALQVQNVLTDSVRHRLQFVVRCADEQLCGSFLVSTALAETPSHAAPRKPKLRTQGKTLAHTGQPAMLSMGDGGIRISVRVICLEPGALGQTIRVRDPVSRRIFRAEVVGAGALRASL